MTLSISWAVQRQAADCLGISERTLHRWRAAGLLQPGQHFRRKFPNPNSPLLYHLERCEQAMNEACCRQPERLEVASICSTFRPFETAPTTDLERASRSSSLPTSPHRPTQGEPSKNAEALADGVINAAAGAIAKHPGGVKGGQLSYRPGLRSSRRIQQGRRGHSGD